MLKISYKFDTKFDILRNDTHLYILYVSNFQNVSNPTLIMMRRAESRRDPGYYVRSSADTPQVVPRQWSPRGMNGQVCFQKTRFVHNERFFKKKYFCSKK